MAKNTSLNHVFVAIDEFAQIFGPYFTEEEKFIVVKLSHDRGMRFRAKLIGLGAFYVNEIVFYPPPITSHISFSEFFYTIKLCDISVKWPARRIYIGDGQYQYI